MIVSSRLLGMLLLCLTSCLANGGQCPEHLARLGLCKLDEDVRHFQGLTPYEKLLTSNLEPPPPHPLHHNHPHPQHHSHPQLQPHPHPSPSEPFGSIHYVNNPFFADESFALPSISPVGQSQPSPYSDLSAEAFQAPNEQVQRGGPIRGLADSMGRGKKQALKDIAGLVTGKTVGTKAVRVVGGLIGDVVGIIISEIIRKFGDLVGDVARYGVKELSSFMLLEGGKVMSEVLGGLMTQVQA